jgi:hypothetical protein
MTVAALFLVKFLALMLAIRAFFWCVSKGISAWRDLTLALFAAAMIATAAAQEPEPEPEPPPPPPTPEELTAQHRRTIETVAFGGFGLILARVFFGSWKR